MITVQISVQGTLAKGLAPDIAREALHNTVQSLIETGDETLALMARPRPAGVYKSYAEGGTSTGNYRRNMHSEVRNLAGFITDSGVIYGPWLEGVGSRNATTRFKGYSMFRRTAQHLGAMAYEVAEQQVARMVRRLNGVT